MRTAESKKLPDYISVIGESVLDIKPYSNVVPVIHTALGREGIHIFLCIVNRQCKFSELQEVVAYFLPSLIAACAAARRAIGTRKGEQDT